jgi:hypothetical protein
LVAVAFAAVVSSARAAPDAQPAPAEAPQASQAPAAEPTKAVQLGADIPVFQVHSPFDDVGRTGKLIDGLAASLILGMEYSEDSGAVQDMAGSLASSLQVPHGFSRKTGNGKRRLIVAAIASPSGGYDIFVAGAEGNAPRKPNPDLATLRDAVGAYIDAQRSARPATGSEWLGSLIYQLNYTQADRALAMLKALGYSTIEYTSPADGPGEKIYSMLANGDGAKLPMIIKLIDASKTSLLDPAPAPPAVAAAAAAAGGGSTPSAAVDLGGTYLHTSTAGDPQQRLLLLHDKRAPEGLERLLNQIQDLDAPARQVVIDAQVVEITEGYTTDLGLDWASMFDKGTASYTPQTVGDKTIYPAPYIFTYDTERVANAAKTFRVKLQALETNGDANTLSSPSVLVLDGRQARIQVGKQVPLNKSFATGQVISSEPVYIPVGIVLNIKPRVNEDGKYVTMQVETIVSDTRDGAPGAAPALDNRQVQSFVRVADNTPFIIGGLFSDNLTTSNAGLPWLSRIPILGVLFRQSNWHRGKREVIIVVTPHVVPAQLESGLSYVVPKASDKFNSLDSKLFRNAYRVKASDVDDLRYIADNPSIQQVLGQIRKRAGANPLLGREEPFASIARGRVPGEEALIHRMLWQIAERTGFASLVHPERILVNPQRDGEVAPPISVLQKLQQLPQGTNTLSISFPTAVNPDSPFRQLGASFGGSSTNPDTWTTALRNANRRLAGGEARAWTLLLSDQSVSGLNPLHLLQASLVVKRLLQLNPRLPSTLRGFLPGIQIIFPAKADLEESLHTVDAQTAQLFFEIAEPYAAFQDSFTAETVRMDKLLKENSPAAVAGGAAGSGL